MLQYSLKMYPYYIAKCFGHKGSPTLAYLAYTILQNQAVKMSTHGSCKRIQEIKDDIIPARERMATFLKQDRHADASIKRARWDIVVCHISQHVVLIM